MLSLSAYSALLTYRTRCANMRAYRWCPVGTAGRSPRTSRWHRLPCCAHAAATATV
jgi:hypothetical protein